ncbi:MAG: alpha/beta hydrolase [Hyphomonadaceae bacterium]|nr:alpha/beta hydrolase [Hyphomonadaceae bacterium]
MRRLLKAAVTGAITGSLLVSCAPSAPKEQPSLPQATAEMSSPAPLTPVSSDYADINGIKLYHEVYGQGEPLVLLHGGLMTIGEMSTLLEPLAKTHKVIAVELQGHGRTADTDRPLKLETMGDDIAVLLDQLNIPQADIVGYSLGADVALRAAIQHPDKVRRLVVISTAHKHKGWYPEVQEGMGQVDHTLADGLAQTPTGAFAKEWPDPKRFAAFLDKLGVEMKQDYDWSDEIRKLPMPVLLVFADNDSIPQKNIAEFFALLGGGVKEPGWMNTQLSKARLAIIPGYSHYNFMTSTELPAVIDKYLADPLTNPPAGAAAASQASGDNTKQ